MSKAALAKACAEDLREARRLKHNASQKAYYQRRVRAKAAAAQASRALLSAVVANTDAGVAGGAKVVGKKRAVPPERFTHASVTTIVTTRCYAFMRCLGEENALDLISYLLEKGQRTPEQALELALHVDELLSFNGCSAVAASGCDDEEVAAMLLLHELHGALLRDGLVSIASAVFGTAGCSAGGSTLGVADKPPHSVLGRGAHMLPPPRVSSERTAPHSTGTLTLSTPLGSTARHGGRWQEEAQPAKRPRPTGSLLLARAPSDAGPDGGVLGVDEPGLAPDLSLAQSVAANGTAPADQAAASAAAAAAAAIAAAKAAAAGASDGGGADGRGWREGPHAARAAASECEPPPPRAPASQPRPLAAPALEPVPLDESAPSLQPAPLSAYRRAAPQAAVQEARSPTASCALHAPGEEELLQPRRAGGQSATRGKPGDGDCEPAVPAVHPGHASFDRAGRTGHGVSAATDPPLGGGSAPGAPRRLVVSAALSRWADLPLALVHAHTAAPSTARAITCEPVHGKAAAAAAAPVPFLAAQPTVPASSLGGALMGRAEDVSRAMRAHADWFHVAARRLCALGQERLYDPAGGAAL